MKVTMLLADAVQEQGTKLFILGGGWAFTGPDVPPMALAIVVEVPWMETNEKHSFRLSLQDEDGQLAQIGPDAQVIQFQGEMEVGRPPGHPPGVPFNVPLAINIPPLPLTPGKRYVWVFDIDGKSDPSWRTPFGIRPRQAMPPSGT